MTEQEAFETLEKCINVIADEFGKFKIEILGRLEKLEKVK